MRLWSVFPAPAVAEKHNSLSEVREGGQRELCVCVKRKRWREREGEIQNKNELQCVCARVCVMYGFSHVCFIFAGWMLKSLEDLSAAVSYCCV